MNHDPTFFGVSGCNEDSVEVAARYRSRLRDHSVRVDLGKEAYLPTPRTLDLRTDPSTRVTRQ
jgi:hypothetical protein